MTRFGSPAQAGFVARNADGLAHARPNRTVAPSFLSGGHAFYERRHPMVCRHGFGQHAVLTIGLFYDGALWHQSVGARPVGEFAQTMK
jgi:hypothetical protein